MVMTMPGDDKTSISSRSTSPESVDSPISVQGGSDSSPDINPIFQDILVHIRLKKFDPARVQELLKTNRLADDIATDKGGNWIKLQPKAFEKLLGEDYQALVDALSALPPLSTDDAEAIFFGKRKRLALLGQMLVLSYQAFYRGAQVWLSEHDEAWRAVRVAPREMYTDEMREQDAKHLAACMAVEASPEVEHIENHASFEESARLLAAAGRYENREQPHDFQAFLKRTIQELQFPSFQALFMPKESPSSNTYVNTLWTWMGYADMRAQQQTTKEVLERCSDFQQVALLSAALSVEENSRNVNSSSFYQRWFGSSSVPSFSKWLGLQAIDRNSLSKITQVLEAIGVQTLDTKSHEATLGSLYDLLQMERMLLRLLNAHNQDGDKHTLAQAQELVLAMNTLLSPYHTSDDEPPCQLLVEQDKVVLKGNFLEILTDYARGDLALLDGLSSCMLNAVTQLHQGGNIAVFEEGSMSTQARTFLQTLHVRLYERVGTRLPRIPPAPENAQGNLTEEQVKHLQACLERVIDSNPMPDSDMAAGAMRDLGNYVMGLSGTPVIDTVIDELCPIAERLLGNLGPKTSKRLPMREQAMLQDVVAQLSDLRKLPGASHRGKNNKVNPAG